jgi:hypothetical protein
MLLHLLRAAGDQQRREAERDGEEGQRHVHVDGDELLRYQGEVDRAPALATGRSRDDLL